MDVLPWLEILAWRNRRYRRQPQLKVRTEEQARQFVIDEFQKWGDVIKTSNIKIQ